MSPINDEPDASALARFLSGEASAEGADAIRQWAQSSPQRKLQLERLQKVWIEASNARAGGVGSWDAPAFWSAIESRLASEQATPRRGALNSSPRGIRALGTSSRSRWTTFAATAAACLIIGSALTMWSARARRPNVPVADTERVYQTSRGQRALFRLPDGSAVQLGPASALHVLASYGAPDRIVSLSGDAYFKVTHDPAHPFAVRISNGAIRDLGTRFVVRARAEDRAASVAVAEGRVSLSASSLSQSNDAAQSSIDSLVIGAGEYARLTNDGRITSAHVSTVDPFFAWTEGRLVFDSTPMPAVLGELSRWYDKEFSLNDASLAKTRLTTILRGETLSEALLVLETSLDVDARVERGKVILTRRDVKRAK